VTAMAHSADAWRAGTRRLGHDGPVPGTAAARSSAVLSGARTVRSWPLLVLAAPAAAEVWSGWVGIAQKTGFGRISPLPGIWPSLHLDTTITLPVGVEAYAAYALRAWLAREYWISDRTRRFAKWSAICSFALGMAGQVAYHLLAQAGTARAPWPITTLVSCLPVLVLAMGTALAHMLRADAHTAPDGPDDNRTAGPVASRSPAWSVEDRAGPVRDQTADQPTSGSGPPARTRTVSKEVHGTADRTRTPAVASHFLAARRRLPVTVTDNLFADLADAYPRAWSCLSAVTLAYGAGGGRWPYRVPATPVPELPLAEVDAPKAENHEDAVVLSGIDTRFDQLMVQRMQQAAENGDTVWLTASLSRISRNLGKLLRAMEYLLAHHVPILTANYLLRPHEVWVRRGELAPVDHKDPLAAWRVSRGLSGVHRATVAEVVTQLEAKGQATGD
jgi:hypothetical protein